MAKRFINGKRWDEDWYRELGSKWRDIWSYLNDKCDHAGLWEVSLSNLSHFTQTKVSLEEILEQFGERVILVSPTKLFVRTFFEEQYGGTERQFRAKTSALAELAKYGVDQNYSDHLYSLPKSLTSYLNCAGKGKGKGKGKGECEGKQTTVLDFESAYKAYPRHEGKDAGIKNLSEQIKDQAGLDSFSKAVFHYSALVRKRGTEHKFIKLFSSFVGTKRTGFPWQEYLVRPQELDLAPINQNKGPPPIRYASAEKVLEEQELQRDGPVSTSAESIAKVRDLMAKAGNLGLKKEGA